MLINSNNLPIRIIGDTSVSRDLVDFLRSENLQCKIEIFEEIKKDQHRHQYQYIVGVFKNLKLRNEIISWLEGHKFNTPSFVHSQSFFSSATNLDSGTIIFPMASVLVSVVGKYCVVTPHCHVGHDATINDHCLLLPGSSVLGSAYLAKGTVLQTGATVNDQIRISAEHVNLLPRSLVTTNIDKTGTYGGSPARMISSKQAIDSEHFK